MTATDQILTRSEAMARAKVTNVRSWARYCRAFGVRSLSRNRYALRAVDRAIEREVRGASK